jgi:hypothetical protein
VTVFRAKRSGAALRAVPVSFSSVLVGERRVATLHSAVSVLTSRCSADLFPLVIL